MINDNLFSVSCVMAAVTDPRLHTHHSSLVFYQRVAVFRGCAPAAKLPRGPSEPGLTWHEGQRLTKATGIWGGGGGYGRKELIFQSESPLSEGPALPSGWGARRDPGAGGKGQPVS